MFFRYTIAFVLVAVAAGACSQPQQETVTPETAASSTTESAAPPADTASSVTASTTILVSEVSPSSASSSTVPSSATIPEIEFSPVTALPARPAVTAVPEVLLRNGVAMVGWDLTVETAEVVDAAVEACSEVFATSIMTRCVAAVQKVCDSTTSDRGKLSDAVGPTNFEEPELNRLQDLGVILCTEVYTAQVIELAMVLAAKYGDRYYSEDTSLPFGEDPDYDLQDFEDDYLKRSIVLRAFAEGVKRDFIDFRMYVGRDDWFSIRFRGIDVGPDRFISDEARARVDPLFETLAELKSAFSDSSSRTIKNCLIGLAGCELKSAFSDSSSGPFEGFDAEKVIAFYSADSDNAQRVIDLPEDPEEIELFCDEAFDAARYKKQDWENDLNNCFTAAENCADTLEEDENSICGGLSRRAQLSLKWNTLPRVCAAAEDTKAGDFDDSCRRAVFDIYLNHSGDPRSATLGGDLKALVFFLAQPLIADLPIEYRRFYPLTNY